VAAVVKRLLAATVVVSAAALADIPPDDSWQCRDQPAGATCVTQAGAKGLCTSKLLPRWDYSHGIPPKTIHVEVLICVAPVVAGDAVPRSVLAGLLLALMAGAAAFFSRHRPV
jgi:hypothetical protein